MADIADTSTVRRASSGDANAHAPGSGGALTPLAGDVGSVAMPATVKGVVVRNCPLVGLVMAAVGGVLSMFTVRVTGLEVELLPAES